MALEFVGSQTDSIIQFLNRWGLREAVVTYSSANGEKNIPIPATLQNEEPAMIRGLADVQWLRIAEELLNETRPTFLVSMTKHQDEVKV
ncbi:hypothetical protein NO976_04348 (plasmid) [Planktothrix agardhii]|nr:hypothetical protein NO976_04348 [Planktothrix agardhii]